MSDIRESLRLIDKSLILWGDNMRICKCDKCGTEIKLDEIYVIGISHPNNYQQVYELCEECKGNISDYIALNR